jgi:LPS O-antigen subunit length determinant protein (WzzB/FepE family)
VLQLNQEMRARAIAEADASLGYLEKELQSTSVVPVRDAVAHLIESQVKKRMLANVTQQYVFRIVDHALPADADDPVKPKKILLLPAGPLVGLLLGILAVLVAGDPGARTARPKPG